MNLSAPDLLDPLLGDEILETLRPHVAEIDRLYLMDADGYFHYQARTDDMIVTSGYNVAGPEVEAALIAQNFNIQVARAAFFPSITLTGSAGDTWTVPAGAKLTADQLDAYKAGNLYVNIHTAEHKGGELRTQLKP